MPAQRTRCESSRAFHAARSFEIVRRSTLPARSARHAPRESRSLVLLRRTRARSRATCSRATRCSPHRRATACVPCSSPLRNALFVLHPLCLTTPQSSSHPPRTAFAQSPASSISRRALLPSPLSHLLVSCAPHRAAPHPLVTHLLAPAPRCASFLVLVAVNAAPAFVTSANTPPLHATLASVRRAAYLPASTSPYTLFSSRIFFATLAPSKRFLASPPLAFVFAQRKNALLEIPSALVALLVLALLRFLVASRVLRRAYLLFACPYAHFSACTPLCAFFVLVVLALALWLLSARARPLSAAPHTDSQRTACLRAAPVRSAEIPSQQT